MLKKEITKLLEQQRREYQRYLGVVTEAIEGQIKTVAESMQGMQDQLTVIRDMVARNSEDIESIRMDMHIVRSDLKEKVSREEFIALEKRLIKVEKIAHHAK